jgi:hypothetical protein
MPNNQVGGLFNGYSCHGAWSTLALCDGRWPYRQASAEQEHLRQCRAIDPLINMWPVQLCNPAEHSDSSQTLVLAWITACELLRSWLNILIVT